MAAHNKLTQKQIEAAKADGKQSKLADGGGLYLLLHPNGSKYWRMRYRHGGCEKTLALGVYPAVSLKQARELARAARAQPSRNRPRVVRQPSRATRRQHTGRRPPFTRLPDRLLQRQHRHQRHHHRRRIKIYRTPQPHQHPRLRPAHRPNPRPNMGLCRPARHHYRRTAQPRNHRPPTAKHKQTQTPAPHPPRRVARLLPRPPNRPRPAPVRPPPAAACRPDRPPSVRTAFRPLARHRPHRPVMAHPRRRHEDQTPLYRPTVGLGSRNTPRAAHTDRRQHPPFPRHPPTAQTRPPSRPHQHQIRPQRHPTTGL